MRLWMVSLPLIWLAWGIVLWIAWRWNERRADRIEELEAALREIQDGDRFGYHAKHFAAAALGEDSDG